MMKKSCCILAAVIVIVCAVCFGRWGQENSDLSFQFEKTVYTYKDEYCSVEDLVYLQMVGSRNKEKERKINQLLEDDRKKCWNWQFLILMRSCLFTCCMF